MSQQFAKGWLVLTIAFALFSGGRARADHPATQREFRGLFVATAYNLDWPTNSTDDVPTQKGEIDTIVTRAKAMNLNVIVLQVRAFGDRIHRKSAIASTEPWSIVLTGTENHDPDPSPPDPAKPYDPLHEWIARAHAQGLELHIWVNPFRCRTGSSFAHFTGKPLDGKKQEWNDPSDKKFRDHLDEVFTELICYDRATSTTVGPGGPGGEGDGDGIDGVVLDHYTPPDPDGGGGEAKNADDKRENINKFVRELYQLVKKQGYGIKFGISPRAVARKGHPPTADDTIDMYDELYADTQKWVEKGWFDYMAPELYGEVNKTGQYFPYLLQWWSTHNTSNDHDVKPIVVAGLNPNSVATSEIKSEIALARDPQLNTWGQIHYAWRKMNTTVGGTTVGDTIKSDNYPTPALVPRCAEAVGKEPVTPKLTSTTHTSVAWDLGTDSPFVWLWEVWTHDKTGDKWDMSVFPATTKSITGLNSTVDQVTVQAVDRYNRESTAITATPNP